MSKNGLLETTSQLQVAVEDLKIASRNKYEDQSRPGLYCLLFLLQSTLVISTSLISNNRLSQSEDLVPVLKWESKNM